MTIKNIFRLSLYMVLLTICFSCTDNSSGDSPRVRENFDFDWRFTKGDFPDASQKDFDDSQWQKIDVPHDWAITDTFSPDNPSGHAGGFASGGVGWYRRSEERRVG